MEIGSSKHSNPVARFPRLPRGSNQAEQVRQRAVASCQNRAAGEDIFVSNLRRRGRVRFWAGTRTCSVESTFWTLAQGRFAIHRTTAWVLGSQEDAL